MTDPWVAIQRNPTSGSGRRAKLLLELVATLKSHGIRTRLFKNRQRLQEFLANPEQRAALKCIVAAGGDGTARDVINRYPNVPMAVLPLGTENLIAKYLKIPKSGRFVGDMIANGHVCRVDLCEFNEQKLAIMASVGFDAAVIHRMEEVRKGHISKLSYLQPILHSLRKYRHPEVRFYLDDNPEPVIGKLGLIANLPSYAFRIKPAPGAVATDGLLDVWIFERGSKLQIARYLYQIFRGRHDRLKDVQHHLVRQVRLESTEQVPVQVDGDVAGWTPLTFRVLPSALDILVPADHNFPADSLTTL